ncbi:MAG: AraC family transcriptional regulator [Kiritimatiellales bacterium]
MLTYLGYGLRQYGQKPFAPVIRNYWEFQAVINGEIGILFPEGPDFLHSRTLWIFPPKYQHGWTGNSSKPAEVAVFQFRSIPPAIEHYCETSASGYLIISLTAAQCSQLRQLTEDAKSYQTDFGQGAFICHQHILFELCFLAYTACVKQHGEHIRSHSQQCVQKALQWYNDHMEDNPGQLDIAKAAGVSVAHLRRLFHEVFERSPRDVIAQIKFDRAIQLMSTPGIKLIEVAERCGFQSASAFSRAFKTFFGYAPVYWRK